MHIFRNSIIVMILGLFPMLTACSAKNNTFIHEEKMTVAKVQKEIKIGMSASDVIGVLGSPNMITTDADRRETWVYDRVSTQIQSATASSGVWLLIFGGNSSNYATSSNQRTLTIIIKFDDKSLVRDFAYRTSSF